MKTLMTLIAVAITLTLATVANAASRLEIETSTATSTETFRIYSYKPLAENIGAFSFIVVTEGWGQAYAGLDYTPTKWLDLGLGYGVETAGNNERWGGYVIANEGRFSLQHFFEDGGSGEFRQTFVTAKVSDKLTLGVADNLFKGTGPMADYRLSKDQTLRVVAFPETVCISVFTSF